MAALVILCQLSCQRQIHTPALRSLGHVPQWTLPAHRVRTPAGDLFLPRTDRSASSHVRPPPRPTRDVNTSVSGKKTSPEGAAGSEHFRRQMAGPECPGETAHALIVRWTMPQVCPKDQSLVPEPPRDFWRLRHAPCCVESGSWVASCHGGGLAGFELDRAEHAQGAVAALAVMEDLQVVKDRVG
jgi:hypothetical protein